MIETAFSEDEQLAFFDAVHGRFEEARARAGSVAFDLALAGTTIRLLFAGEALVGRLTPALAHLATAPAASPDATFCIWESRTTGVAMAPRPCTEESFSDRGDIWGFHSRRIKAAFHYHDFSVNLFDHERATGIYWVHDAEHLPYWVDASPLRTLFHWRMERVGCQLLHAAAVGTEAGAILVTGRGGIGKSSTALACAEAGLSYLGDDYVVVGRHPEPTVHSLYSTAKLAPQDLGRYPSLARLASFPRAGAAASTPAPGGLGPRGTVAEGGRVLGPPGARAMEARASQDPVKAVLHLHPARAGQIARSLPLAAISVPRIVAREESAFVPEAPHLVQKAASLTTMSQLPNVGRHTYDFFGAICSAVPTYALELGSDPRGVARAVEEFLRDGTAGRAAHRSSAAGERTASRPDSSHRTQAPPAPASPMSAEPAQAPSQSATLVPASKAPGPEGSSHVPLVSVVIPVWNGERFLKDAVASVLAQGYPSLEIIVVDDGSTDGTPRAATELPCEVRYIRQKNGGPAKARNRGIRDASGEFLAFLDVDDLWPEKTIRTLIDALLAEPALDVVHGHAQLVVRDEATGEDEYRGNPTEAFPYYIGAGIYRTRAFVKVGLFDPTLLFGEDTDWYTRARERRAGVRRIEAVTLLVRRHDANMTRDRTQVELSRLRVFKKALDRERDAPTEADAAPAD